MGFFEDLEEWKKANPKKSEDIEKMLQVIQKSAAFTYQPLIFPNLEIKVTNATPSLQL